MNTKYAIVITTYNREHLLRECIEKVNAQTIPPEIILIVNNASTDGTYEYIEGLPARDSRYIIINLSKNIGGAGGFAKGIEAVINKCVDCVLLIDDDAMLSEDYMQQTLYARQNNPQYRAFAGTVWSNGKIDTSHRKNFSRIGLLQKPIEVDAYNKPYFACDAASFCGMLVDMEIIRLVGVPHAEYFIWQDDAEYSLRIKKHTLFLNVTEAKLTHRTNPPQLNGKRRYDWREYYAVRNRILMVREHGNICDRIVNSIDLFIHVVFRNWLFGLLKKDNYNWEYEKYLVKEAITNANSSSLQNIIIKRKE